MAAGKSKIKKALGRGLDSLLPDYGESFENTENFLECDTDIILPNRYQPRSIFSEESIAELVNSIKEQGIIQPLVVRKHENGYELAAGERRLRAAKKAGLLKVPVVVRGFSDSEMLEISIIENVQRENLNPIEEADAYRRLIDEFSLTQEQVAKRVGKSRPAIANFLRLRQLPDEIKNEMKNGTLSMGHARALLGAGSEAQQSRAFKTIIAKKLSVREAENLIKKLKSESEPEKNKESKMTSEELYFADLAQVLSRKIGSRVQITKRGKKGSVRIEFYNDDDLERIIKALRIK